MCEHLCVFCRKPVENATLKGILRNILDQTSQHYTNDSYVQLEPENSIFCNGQSKNGPIDRISLSYKISEIRF